MRKIILSIFIIIIVLLLDCLFILNILSYNKILNDVYSLIDSRADEISNFLTKYSINTTGVLDVDVNYRGAHGENYPSKYTYNYELSDKLYLENIEYTSINYDKNILSVLKKLAKLNNIDKKMCSNVKRKNGELDITCDEKIINEIFDTNFLNINATVYTKGWRRKFDHIIIYIDDFILTLFKDDLIIDYKKDNIKISFSNSSYYVNINDLFKANIIINDLYSCSFVINDNVYYLEVRENELYIKFNSPSLIYNNISINAKYESVLLDKTNELENIKDNPIANYIKASNFNIWRQT